MLRQLPKWVPVQPIEREIKRRFSRTDADDLKARLDRLTAFETKWEPERSAYSKRLGGLRAHFNKMLEEAVKWFSGAQYMSD